MFGMYEQDISCWVWNSAEKPQKLSQFHKTDAKVT